MPRTVTIVRHGYREDFVDGALSPEWQIGKPYPLDPDLAEKGIREAKATASRLATEPIDHILCSPFLRTVHTAHHIATALGKPTKIENGLHEWMHPSAFSAIAKLRTLNELKAQFMTVDTVHSSTTTFSYPENAFEDVERRCAKTLDAILKSTEGNLLLVTHADPLAAMMIGTGAVLTKPVRTCAIYRLTVDGADVRLELEGEDLHLEAID